MNLNEGITFNLAWMFYNLLKSKYFIKRNMQIIYSKHLFESCLILIDKFKNKKLLQFLTDNLNILIITNKDLGKTVKFNKKLKYFYFR